MTLDLYKDDFTASASADLYKSIEDFAHMSEPISNRPRENFRLDYKEKWETKALRTIAAFANTFGGLLIVGIREGEKEHKGLPDAIVGIQSSKEEKTRIASSIASNISPTPAFDTAECTLPQDPTRRLCVIRVRRGTTLHYLMVKSEQPVYVRNDSESRPADAAQLRSLIEQKLEAPRLESELPNRIDRLKRTLVVNTSGALVSPTCFSILVLPFSRIRLRIDYVLENQFDNLIERQYPRLAERIHRRIAVATKQTERDSFEIRWREPNREYERRWRLTSACDFGFITQTKLAAPQMGNYWSLYDTIADLGFTLKVTRALWDLAGYYGDARVLADLNVTQLPLFSTSGYPGFGSLFYGSTESIGKFGIFLSNSPADTATAELDISFASLTIELADTVTELSNQLLRSLRHSVDFQKLHNQIQALLGPL